MSAIMPIISACIVMLANGKGDTADYLAVTNSIDQQIEEMDAVCRYTQAKARSKKRPFLCFDEWNVWYRTQNAESVNGHGKFAQHLVEEEYNLEDATGCCRLSQ